MAEDIESLKKRESRMEEWKENAMMKKKIEQEKESAWQCCHLCI